MDMYQTMRRALAGIAVAAFCSTAASGQAAPAVHDAPLLPGDRVVVKIWVDTTFGDMVRVDETGSLTLPRVGPLRIANVPASQVADSVRNAYARVIRTLAIEVTALRRVTVGGEVKSPGVYYLETHATLREAVALAGGITEIGATGTLRLMRGDAEHAVEGWAVRSGDELIVRSSDVIWVSREPWLKRNALSIISGAGVLLSVILSLSK